MRITAKEKYSYETLEAVTLSKGFAVLTAKISMLVFWVVIKCVTLVSTNKFSQRYNPEDQHRKFKARVFIFQVSNTFCRLIPTEKNKIWYSLYL